MPRIINIDNSNNYKIFIDNYAPYDITVDRNNVIGIIGQEQETLFAMEDSFILVILSYIKDKLPKVAKKKFSQEAIEQKVDLNMPKELKKQYVDILFKHQDAIIENKFYLGLAKNFQNKIHLKDNMCTGNNSKFHKPINVSLNNL
jgi:hypothetical protein